MMLEWDRTNEKSGIILDNKKGITDWKTLNEVERRYSYIRLPELEKIDNNKKIVFNKEYFLSIHKYLFQDIYPWAGTIREVDLFKDNSAFAPARFLDGSLNDFFENLKRDNFLSGFNTDEVSELASYYMLELNFIHPFREGNGRTKRHFMTQLVKGAGYDLGLDRIRPEELVMADILAFDDNESGIKANPSYFKNVIKTALKPSNEQNIKPIQNESKLDKLNRFLWVYDRFSENAYFRAYNSLSEAEKKLSEQLSTDAGKERIKRYLDRIITKEKAYQDGTAEYRQDIIKLWIISLMVIIVTIYFVRVIKNCFHTQSVSKPTTNNFTKAPTFSILFHKTRNVFRQVDFLFGFTNKQVIYICYIMTVFGH